MARRGEHLLGVRLDRGDMTILSKMVRGILDAAGLLSLKIHVFFDPLVASRYARGTAHWSGFLAIRG